MAGQRTLNLREGETLFEAKSYFDYHEEEVGGRAYAVASVAVLVSLAAVVWRASEPRLTFLGRPRGYLEPEDLETAPAATIPGLLIVRPDEMLFFANASPVRDAVLRAASDAEPRPTVVLLDLSLPDSQGKWKGLDIDVCRAVAASFSPTLTS